MDWITDKVAIGNKQEGRNPELLRQHGFRSVLSLDGTHCDIPVGELGVEILRELHLYDGYGNDPKQFRLAIDSLAELVASHSPVFVHCNLGQNRSPAVVAGYLAITNRIKPYEGLALVAARHAVRLRPPLEDLLEALPIDLD